MSRLLSKNEAAWEAIEMQKGEKRSYHLSDLYEAATSPEGDFRRYVRASTERLLDSRRWRHVPHTEEFASLKLAVFSRSVSVLHQLVILQCAAYPAKLISIVQHPWRAEEVVSEFESNPCKFDCWSKEHLSRHSSVDSLLSPPSLLTLALVGHSCMGNTFDTERAHTKNVCKTKQRLTHALLLSDLALWAQAEGGPTWMELCRGCAI